ncbi:prepilin peptidase [Micrococcus sp.]|uniref:prepilin peptidase n=1 Tax=Micrococcus sp. TaxID=1271 RepID=UPI002A910E21|nr:prepilin peptidase [Micrococcus sp.]MDY6055357.1 prepilin peptidase [Micrococcus sp.]
MSWWGWAVAEQAWASLAMWGVGLVWAVVCLAVLVRTDLREHRLPNRWTGRLALAGVVLMAGGAAAAGRWDLTVSSLLGGAGYAAAMLGLHLVSQGGLGMGDVKLAIGLGLYCGLGGPAAVVLAGLAAVLLGGAASLVLVLLRRAGRRTAIPFGPAMAAGAAVGMLV